MRATWLGLALGLCTIAPGAPAPAQPPGGERADRPATDPPGIRASQLAVSCERDGGQVRFRATVLARRPGLLTIMTAAHCLGPDDRGRTLRVVQGEVALECEVLAVVRNPAYGSIPDGEIPGADNALAWVRHAPADAALVERFEPVRLADEPLPDAQVVPVYAIDQFEEAHAVKAGNFSNPKWLQWGDVYKPIPGDSGSGVFAYRRGDDGRPEPTLVGVVTDRDRVGGGASVVCRRHRWIAETLAEAERELDAAARPAAKP
jgi:hypothetical protein